MILSSTSFFNNRQWELKMHEKEQSELKKFDTELKNMKLKSEEELSKINAELENSPTEKPADILPAGGEIENEDGNLNWLEMVRRIEADISEGKTTLSEGQKFMLDLIKKKSTQ